MNIHKVLNHKQAGKNFSAVKVDVDIHNERIYINLLSRVIEIDSPQYEVDKELYGITGDPVVSDGVREFYPVPEEPYVIDMDYLRSKRGWADYQVFALVQKGDAPERMVALFEQTLNSRESIQEYASRLGVNIPFFLMVPFKDAKLSDCEATVHIPAGAGGVVVLGDGKLVESTAENHVQVRESFMPTLALETESLGGGEYAVRVSLVTAEGTPIRKPGVDIYLETTAGYFSQNRKLTDETGTATVSLYVGNVSDPVKVKVGFKFYPGLKEVTLQP